MCLIGINFNHLSAKKPSPTTFWFQTAQYEKKMTSRRIAFLFRDQTRLWAKWRISLVRFSLIVIQNALHHSAFNYTKNDFIVTHDHFQTAIGLEWKGNKNLMGPSLVWHVQKYPQILIGSLLWATDISKSKKGMELWSVLG